MINVQLNVNSAALLVALKDGQKKVRYAIRNAINNTALEVQRHERRSIAAQYKLRKPAFILRQAAVIKPFASLEQLSAQISVGSQERLLLRYFELQEERVGQTALHTLGVPGVAVPARALRPTPATIVPQSMWISRLQLRHEPSAQVIRGKRGVFIKETRAIFQQVVGPGRAKLLYIIKKTVKKARPYRFADIAVDVANRKFGGYLNAEVASTIKHAMGG